MIPFTRSISTWSIACSLRASVPVGGDFVGSGAGGGPARSGSRTVAGSSLCPTLDSTIDQCAILGGMPTRRAFALAIVLAAPSAHAEGEYGPMFGGGIMATHGDADVAGIGAEMVLWYGPLGVAAEASRQWTVDDVAGPRVGSISGSLRLLAFDQVVPSLLDSRDVVDLGIELHGIVERSWWDDERDLTQYGVGLALRLRGVNDDDRSNLLAESRVFVRVLRPRESEMAVARETMPAARADSIGVMIGLGALWGAGKAAYVERLRRNTALDSEWLVGR